MPNGLAYSPESSIENSSTLTTKGRQIAVDAQTDSIQIVSRCFNVTHVAS
jgi:hypothetical protein